jgi:hypothetical protein
MEKMIAAVASFAGLLLLSSVSLLAAQGEVLYQGDPPAQTEIVIRIDGFTTYRLPLF